MTVFTKDLLIFLLTNYPNPETKPLDYGIGPFIDSFPDLQHKFGPWKPIMEYRKNISYPLSFDHALR